MSEAPAFDADIEYPTSDGRPVAETPLHYRRLADAAHALTTLFDSQASVYVGVNMLVYDEPGNPKRHLSPDIFIAFGVEDRYRDIYKLWEEEAPAFVLEVTSKTTRREDDRKKSRYARWGVSEYFIYDPRAEYVKPPLKGFSLVGGAYRPMTTRVLPNGVAGFWSESLGLYLWLDGFELRFYRAGTGRNLRTPSEEVARADAEAARADAEAARADAEAARAEAEAARRRQLEAELAGLKQHRHRSGWAP